MLRGGYNQVSFYLILSSSQQEDILSSKIFMRSVGNWKKWLGVFVLLNLFLHCSSLSPGTVKKNTPLPFPLEVDGVVQNTAITIDQNWRWWHETSGFKNCYDNGFDKTLCPDEATCSKNCAIEGVDATDYDKAYGVTVSNKVLRLNFARQNDHGLNIGSRVYLVDPSLNKYQGFDLRQKELSFTIDLSTAGCGLNSAVYFVEMPLIDPFGVGSAYGVNYGDAQCAQDIKFVGGQVNFGEKGACSMEMDILEANRHASAITAHPCRVKGVTVCLNDSTCGTGSFRYSGFCDRNGADYNPYRMGNHTVYGYGSNYTIDSSKPFVVVSRFITDDGTTSGTLIRIDRLLRQSGKEVLIGSLTDQSIAATKNLFKEHNHFQEIGGLKIIGESFARKMVLVFSFWDDSSTHMQWLDSSFGGNPSSPGVVRGPCPNPPLSTEETRKQFKDAFVLFSDLKVKSLSMIPPSGSPTQSPTKPPSPGQGYWKCNQCNWVTIP